MNWGVSRPFASLENLVSCVCYCMCITYIWKSYFACPHDCPTMKNATSAGDQNTNCAKHDTQAAINILLMYAKYRFHSVETPASDCHDVRIIFTVSKYCQHCRVWFS